MNKLKTMDEKSWLEVFDCYFGDKKNQYDFTEPKDDNDNNSGSEKMDIPEDVIGLIEEIKEKLGSGELSEGFFDDELGLPDVTTETSHNGIKYVKKVWHHTDGDIVKLEVIDSVDFEKYEDLTITEKIALAVQNEDYELAEKLKNDDDANFLDGITKKDD